MNNSSFFRRLWRDVKAVFGDHLPHGWEETTDELLVFLNKAKTWSESDGAMTLAAMAPKGLGTIALDRLHHLFEDAIPTLEIAVGARGATLGITDPVEHANAIAKYVFEHINRLPEDMRGKHWEDIARKIMEVELQLSTTAAKALLNTLLGKMKA